MAIRTLTETLDNLYTTTWQNMKASAHDQIYDATPFWFWMKQNGRLKTENGGRFLSEPLQYDKNDNIQWIGKGGTVPLNDFEHLTIAKYEWKYLTASIVRFGVDDQQNRGKNQIINFMKSKLSNTQDALADELETRLFGSTEANAFDGLQVVVADDPTAAAATTGGIDPSVYTWWQSKQINNGSFAADGIDEMRQMLNNTSNNKRRDRPDIIVSGQSPYEFYEKEIVDNFFRVTNNKLADAGFDSQQFKGIPMVWSPACANTRMYFLNTNFLALTYDPMMNFDMTEWKPIPDQVNDRAAQIILAGNFVSSKRRCQGVIHAISA